MSDWSDGPPGRLREHLLRFLDKYHQISEFTQEELVALEPSAELTELIQKLGIGLSLMRSATPSDLPLGQQSFKVDLMLAYVNVFGPERLDWEIDRLRDLLDQIHPRPEILSLESVQMEISSFLALQGMPPASATQH